MKPVSPAGYGLLFNGSMLTGVYPGRLGLTTLPDRFPADGETLAFVLAREGYATAAAVNSIYLSEKYGLDREFEWFRYLPGEKPITDAAQSVFSEVMRLH